MARPSAALDVRLRAPQQQLIPVGRRAWMAAGRCCCCWACHAGAPACASSHTSQALTAASPRRTDRETGPWSHSPAGTAVGRPAHVSGLGQNATIHTACDCCASARRLHPGVPTTSAADPAHAASAAPSDGRLTNLKHGHAARAVCTPISRTPRGTAPARGRRTMRCSHACSAYPQQRHTCMPLSTDPHVLLAASHTSHIAHLPGPRRLASWSQGDTGFQVDAERSKKLLSMGIPCSPVIRMR